MNMRHHSYNQHYYYPFKAPHHNHNQFNRCDRYNPVHCNEFYQPKSNDNCFINAPTISLPLLLLSSSSSASLSILFLTASITEIKTLNNCFPTALLTSIESKWISCIPFKVIHRLMAKLTIEIMNYYHYCQCRYYWSTKLEHYIIYIQFIAVDLNKFTKQNIFLLTWSIENVFLALKSKQKFLQETEINIINTNNKHNNRFTNKYQIKYHCEYHQEYYYQSNNNNNNYYYNRKYQPKYQTVFFDYIKLMRKCMANCKYKWSLPMTATNVTCLFSKNETNDLNCHQYNLILAKSNSFKTNNSIDLYRQSKQKNQQQNLKWNKMSNIKTEHNSMAMLQCYGKLLSSISLIYSANINNRLTICIAILLLIISHPTTMIHCQHAKQVSSNIFNGTGHCFQSKMSWLELSFFQRKSILKFKYLDIFPIIHS